MDWEGKKWVRFWGVCACPEAAGAINSPCAEVPETTCGAIFNLHARPAFSSLSETVTADCATVNNITW